MNTPIYSKRFDISFIILPGMIAVLLIIIGNTFNFFPESIGPLWWLVIVVCLDVGHVWSTLFRTYFHKKAFQEFKKELILIPIFCWGIGAVAYGISAKIFWVMMAYLALFHFVKQQIGILKIYLRKKEGFWVRDFDIYCLYIFILVPVIHWHLNSKSFYWFVPDDFFHLEIPYLETISWGIYVCAWLILILKELNSRINIHFYKLGHMISTALVWIVGIVLYDNDWSFTSSNIVHHGVPYLALIWVSTMRGEYQTPFIPFTRFLSKMKKYRIFLYLFLVCFLGYSEEFLWDIFVWHEHSSVFLSGLNFEVSKTVLTLLVPLLSTPQLTHYILDGIIWKRERKIEGFSF